MKTVNPKPAMTSPKMSQFLDVSLTVSSCDMMTPADKRLLRPGGTGPDTLGSYSFLEVQVGPLRLRVKTPDESGGLRIQGPIGRDRRKLLGDEKPQCLLGERQPNPLVPVSFPHANRPAPHAILRLRQRQADRELLALGKEHPGIGVLPQVVEILRADPHVQGVLVKPRHVARIGARCPAQSVAV